MSTKFRTTETVPAETTEAIMGRVIINPEKRYLSDKICIFGLVISANIIEDISYKTSPKAQYQTF